MAEIGRGSPTGFKVYRHWQFPAKYRDGVLSCCWTLGRIYFFPLTLSGASYTTKSEIFLETVGDVYREGFPWGLVVLLVFAVLLIVFSVQNAETTTVEFFGWDWVMPVALLVMITVLVTLVAVTIGLAFYRRRRRKRRLEKEAARSDR